MAKGILGIASLIALLALLSKGFGFFRELVVAASFGAGAAKDAYTAAYILPAFSLIMLGGLTGPFHTAAQKTITTLRSQQRDAEVPGVIAAILLICTLSMGLLAGLTYLAAPLLIHLVASRVSAPVFRLAVLQLQIMSPLILLGALIGLLCGISNDRNDFVLPSLSPLIASVAVIAVVLIRPDPLSLAWGTTLGGIGQFLLQMPAGYQLLRSSGHWQIHLAHPEVKKLFWLLIPASLSSTIGTLNVIIGTNFASMLPPGAISLFDYANKLLQLPLGILMTALLIPLFPKLTEAAVADDQESLFRWVNRGLTAIALTTLPLIGLFVVAGEPLVAVMYQRGAFTAQATQQTYQVLVFAGLGIFAYAIRDLLIRVFYALHDSRTPLLVTLVSLAVTVATMALLVGPFGLLGLAGATTLVTFCNCLLVGFLLRRKLGRLPLTPALGMSWKALLATLLAAAAAWGLKLGWTPPGTGFGAHALMLILQTALLTGVYLAALAGLGVPFHAFAARFSKAPDHRN